MCAYSPAQARDRARAANEVSAAWQKRGGTQLTWQPLVRALASLSLGLTVRVGGRKVEQAIRGLPPALFEGHRVHGRRPEEVLQKAAPEQGALDGGLRLRVPVGEGPAASVVDADLEVVRRVELEQDVRALLSGFFKGELRDTELERMLNTKTRMEALL